MAARDHREAAELADLLTAARSMLASQRATAWHALDALLPASRAAMSPALLEQVRRNAAARAALAEEFGLLSSAEVAQLARSRAVNTAALASRWRKAGRVLAVDAHGTLRYPGFQFGPDGRPVPVVRHVLRALGNALGGWEQALWFTSPNDRLGGLRPVDVLTTDPEQVADAARALADELLG